MIKLMSRNLPTQMVMGLVTQPQESAYNDSGFSVNRPSEAI